jgi:hypothetical protein
MQSPFIKPVTEYSRDLNILSIATKNAAEYIANMEGISYEDAVAFVERETSSKGAFPIVDPVTKILHRDAKKGRQKAEIPFSQFLDDVQTKEYLMAPTMTNYLNPREKRSILSTYTDGNVDKRKVVKKAGQKNKADGNFEVAAMQHVLQSTFKIKNNSISGAHLSPHNSLYLKSAHPTLTTTCRSATSSSNANTERFLMGNRHYRNADIAINNIVSVVSLSDYVKIEKAMVAYNLHYPTAEEVTEAVKRSTDQYWRSPERFERISQYIANLTPLERAAYIYTQDLYHLMQFNSTIVKELIQAFAVKADKPINNPKEWIDKMDADITALIGIVCTRELKGSTWWDLEKDDPSKYAIVGATVKQTFETLDRFSLLINSFWCTDSPPPSVAYFLQSIRKSVIVSDTDSTIFTVQDWVKWYNDGKLDFDDISTSVGAVMVYLTSQTTVHLLAQLTGSMGVVPEHIPKLSMKNEFYFPVLSLTTKAKHYFSYISAEEGNMYDKLKPEYKGVSLKNSKIPKHIMDRFNTFTENIMDKVMRCEILSLRELLEEVVAIEEEITNSLVTGKTEYLQLAMVKDKGSYKNPESSPYIHYEMWNYVFGPKYGNAPLPPYAGVKLSLDVPNSTAIKVWLSKIEDLEIRHRMEKWLEQQKKKDYKVAILPLEVVSQIGVPKELLQAKDIRKVCATLLEPYILVLESMGIFMKNQYNSKLPSDFLQDLPHLTEC